MTKVMLQSQMFYVSHLDINDPKDLKAIDGFRVFRPEGFGLELYLRKFACNDEIDHFMRTYLVRDKETDELVGYFSLKAGLISYDEKEEPTENVDPFTGENVIVTKFDTIPGIELADFAINGEYINNHPDQKGNGYVIFVDFILPLVDIVSKYAGAKIIYIFALPYEDLQKRYERYGFQHLSEEAENKLHARIKPRYDKSCVFMYQLI